MRQVALAMFLALGGACFAGEETSPTTIDAPILRTSVDWLVNAIPGRNGELAANYVGRTLAIEGWVEEMGRDAKGWYISLRRLSARPTHTRCYFPPGNGGQLDYLYKGATAELVGDCVGYDEETDAVVLRNCRLILPDFNHPDGER